MLQILFWAVVVIVMLALFKGPLIWVLGLLQRGVALIGYWYIEEYTLERIVVTLIVIWLVRKLFNWLFN